MQILWMKKSRKNVRRGGLNVDKRGWNAPGTKCSRKEQPPYHAGEMDMGKKFAAIIYYSILC